MKNPALHSLATHGKTFKFASLLLSKAQVDQAARLYQFCRWVDDIADETQDKSFAKEMLDNVKQQIISGKPRHQITEDYLILSGELGIPINHALTLIDGVSSDLKEVAFVTEDELIEYAYKVAGVVGLMMCPILDAKPQGTAHAIDLGIAMQLTNIARDVMEDAQLGRRYLPLEWCGVSTHQIVEDSDKTLRPQVMQAIRRTLALAERYYQSARQGYRYLPSQSRRAIVVAEAVYREIGVKLERQGLRYWQGRTTITLGGKLWLASSNLISFKVREKAPHNHDLHKPLSKIVGFDRLERKSNGLPHQ